MFNDTENPNTTMSAKRTMMSAERSLMSWTRTGLSMIGFGFTLFQVLQFMKDKDVSLTLTPEGPRRLGLFLIGLGILSIILGGFQYWKTVSFISTEFHMPKWRYPLIVSTLIALLGLVLFFSMIAKVNLV